MKRWLAIAVVVLGLVIAALFWWRSHRETASATDHAGSAAHGSPGEGRRHVDPHTLPHASIAGTVRDDKGAPIAQAQVCAEEVCAATDANGGYQLTDVIAGRYDVVAGAKGFRPGRYENLTVGPRERAIKIDIVLRAGGAEITGTVADVGGGPIAHARVRASRGGPRRQRRWSISIETDANGAFSLWTDPADAVVEASADGYAPNIEEVRAPGKVAIYLTPESSLAGTVVDAASGAPVGGMQVEVGDELAATTDERGQFRIARLPPGRYLAVAHGPHRYGRAEGSTLVGLAQHVDGVMIKVFPASDVSGRVMLGTAPCWYATVRLLDRRRSTVAEATAEEGEVVLEGVPPGTYSVWIACPRAHAHDRYDPLVVADKDLTGLVWPVDAGATIRGHVITKPGARVEDAIVTASPAAATARSGKDGAYELTGLAAGPEKLFAESDAGVSPREGYGVDVRAGEVVTRDLVLDDSGAIAGIVVDARGAPVGDADVFADPHGAHAYGDHRAANSDGTFAIEGLRPGEYRVTPRRNWDELRRPGTTDDVMQGELVTVAAKQTVKVRLVVEAQTGKITGVVVDADGKPVPDAYVSAARESDAAGAPASSVVDTRWGGDRPALTGPDGAFELGPFAPSATYTLRAYRKGGGEAIAEHVAVGSSARLQIKRTGSIAGTVSRSDGTPPDELEVIVAEPKTAFTRRERFYRTGGAFALHDLPAGAFVLTAITPGGRKQVEVPLAEGEAKTGVAIVLDATVTVVGRVVEMGTQQPVPDLAMLARAATGGTVDAAGIGESTTDAAGRFTLTDVPTGRIDIRGYPKEPAAMWTSLQAIRTIAGPGPADVGDLPIRRSRLAKPGDVHGYLGLHFEPLAPATLPEDRRVKVSWIDPQGPAARVDIRVGDVLVSVDGVDIRGDNYGFTNPMLIAPVGTTVTLALERGVSVQLTLGVPP